MIDKNVTCLNCRMPVWVHEQRVLHGCQEALYDYIRKSWDAGVRLEVVVRNDVPELLERAGPKIPPTGKLCEGIVPPTEGGKP